MQAQKKEQALHNLNHCVAMDMVLVSSVVIDIMLSTSSIHMCKEVVSLKNIMVIISTGFPR